MSSRRKKEEIDVSVGLEEPLTSSTCSKLITELIKYLLYQKQQIPFTCEYLTQQVQASSKAGDRKFLAARSTLNSLQSLSEHLNRELILKGSTVSEVSILVGATIVSPRFSVRVSLPTQILSSRNHAEHQHPARKPLLNLMKSMLESAEFQEAMTVPVAPTNTFVLLRKRDCNSISEFFLPKPRYVMSTQATHRFHINLAHEEELKTNCSCTDLIKVYHDSSALDLVQNLNVLSMGTSEAEPCDMEIPYLWYQSKEVIKGFKFVR